MLITLPNSKNKTPKNQLTVKAYCPPTMNVTCTRFFFFLPFSQPIMISILPLSKSRIITWNHKNHSPKLCAFIQTIFFPSCSLESHCNTLKNVNIQFGSMYLKSVWFLCIHMYMNIWVSEKKTWWTKHRGKVCSISSVLFENAYFQHNWYKKGINYIWNVIS